jgi:hypothetical protein
MSKRNKTKLGKCQVCSNTRQLTYEHIPPKSTYNNNKVYYTSNIHPLMDKRDAKTFDELTYFDKSKATKKQGGIGFYSICGACNNFFGTWYVRAYKDWVSQSVNYFSLSTLNDREEFKVTIQPLNVLKQIIAMFFSINDKLSKLSPDLKAFILNKQSKELPSNIRIFIYYNIEGVIRYEPNLVVGDFSNNRVIIASEITFPPLGYVLVTNGENVDERLREITHFSKYELNEVVTIDQNLNILPTHIKFILDYRTKEEIELGLMNNSENLP